MTRHFASYKNPGNPETLILLFFSFLYPNKTHTLLISLTSQSDFTLPVGQLPNSQCHDFKQLVN